MKSPKNILIVDDDVISLDIVSFMFEKKGYSVERCADGFAAVEYALKSKPDLIIVDLMMPEMNGADTVKQMRAKGLEDVPIIAFTAVDEVEYHQKAEDAGCNQVLTKPCRPDRLIKQVEKYFSKED